ncbi:uncharacterized protein N7518_005404 [Penicillium psychrosexuale]|uniref:uncharacterized protein n=1 Tax=Penicillium psychrosexuale TaxID=1002107 RepID=UPI00254546F3|nr:uncharacterized protein N7518_005404 [Penicillium psychrosexuale]KAJ5796864.1 hypothetical protein N7518_005404 [Penicillium psychrosexuale]
MASLGLAYLEDSDSESNTDPDINPDAQSNPPNAQPDPDSLTQPLPPSTQPTCAITMALPPTDRTYATSDEAKDAINDFARPHGYAVTIRRSKTTKRGVKKTVRLICDRGRRPDACEHRPQPKKRINTNTMALECPFSMALRRDHGTGLWHVTIENPSHNHQPSPASTHAVQRTRELTHKREQIVTALRLGRTTRQIMAELHEADPDTAIIPRDIYSTRFRLKQLFPVKRTKSKK